MLEAVYKRLSSFFSHLLESLVSLLKVCVQSRFSVRLPPRRQAACSVLGNGPSLANSLEQHADFIKGTEAVCVNLFASSPAYTIIQPQNYVLLDPAFFSFTENQTNREDIQRVLTNIVERTNWDMTIYVPFKAQRSYFVEQIQQQNPSIRFVYFNYTIVSGFAGLRHWLYKTGLGMPQAQNILVAALFLMLNRRFDQIFLFGADHSWHEEIRLSDTNQLLMRQVHFYDKPGDATFVPVRVNNAQSRMADQFLSLYKAFRGYEVLKEYADHLGAQVLNASAKSYVDAFERVVIRENQSAQ